MICQSRKRILQVHGWCMQECQWYLHNAVCTSECQKAQSLWKLHRYWTVRGSIRCTPTIVVSSACAVHIDHIIFPLRITSQNNFPIFSCECTDLANVKYHSTVRKDGSYRYAVISLSISIALSTCHEDICCIHLFILIFINIKYNILKYINII
jgi:hypothetical protein